MPENKSGPRTHPLVWVALVVMIAIGLRAFAVALLPQDYDEPVYLKVAFDYADAIKEGDFNAVIDYPGVREHPALVKLVYSGAILGLGREASYVNAFYASRAVSAFFGVIAVLLLALLDPFAGGLLGVHTLAVKYTSQVYLEAIPHALTIAAVLAFLRASKGGRDRWFWLSALALGAATAGKFTYIPVIVIVLGYLAFFEKKIPLRWMAAYGLTAAATFFALDVTLWHDPLRRVLEALTFHVGYSQGTHVAEVGYPWYQPFIWVFTSSPAQWHPGVFFYFGFDGLIGLSAFAGIKREWTERRWLVVWLAFGMLFLLLWPTKWPQYALSVTPALCLMAAETLRRLYHWVIEQETYWNYIREMFPQPGKWFWGSVAAFALFIAAIYLSAAVRYTVGRVGWSHITIEGSFLPSNTVHDLLPWSDGQMVIATGKGAALWTPPSGADLPDRWQVFDTRTSGLPSDEVLSLARDAQGNLWLGTARGLARFDGTSWEVFRASDLGLGSDRVNALAAAPDGRLFAGTPNGVAVWEAGAWAPIPSLPREQVFDLFASNGELWIASLRGVLRYNWVNGTQSLYPTTAAANTVIVSSDGVVWAGTSNGLARLQGVDWVYFNSGNSGLPLNTVLALAEVKPGLLWIGTSQGGQSGGALASFDGQTWTVYKSETTGASGAEPLAIVAAGNEVWTGTRTHGIDIYKLGNQP